MFRSITQRPVRALFSLALLLGGCGDAAPPYVVVFRASDERSQPISGVVVEVVGFAQSTGGDGTVPFELKGTEGQTFSVEIKCPPAYRVESADDKMPITLRRITSSNGEGFAPIERKVRCVPTRRRVVVVVSLGKGGAGLPVLVDEQEQARTDEEGVAHLALAAPPSTSIRVKIDTSGNEGLTPPNPVRTYRVPDSDDVFVFDQQIENTARPKAEPRPRKRRRARPGGGGPVRL